MLVTGNIVMNHLDDFESTAIAFFRDIFDKNYEEMFVGEDAELRDFAFSGKPPKGTLRPGAMSMNQLHDAWEKWAFHKIRAAYGIVLSTSQIKLVDLFRQIEQSKIVPTVH